jgi:DNA-binding protein WhiA
VTFTARVRDELGRVPLDQGAAAGDELAGLLRTGGVLALTGGGDRLRVGAVFRTGSGPVARRLRTALRLVDVATDIEVHRPVALQRGTVYVIRMTGPDADVLVDCGLLDRHGRPTEQGRPPPSGDRVRAAAYVRGAVMGGGSLSDPRAAPHAEIAVGGHGTAAHLVALLADIGVEGARATEHGDRRRVVSKSGEAIGTLLATLGAHSAFLEWDAARLRRELRGEANRVANADRANLARAVGAAGRHVAAISRLVAASGWDGIPDDLRPVALARVANTDASLAELGGLLDPPAGKGVVHRRLAALVALAEAAIPTQRQAPPAPHRDPEGGAPRVV